MAVNNELRHPGIPAPLQANLIHHVIYCLAQPRVCLSYLESPVTKFCLWF